MLCIVVLLCEGGYLEISNTAVLSDARLPRQSPQSAVNITDADFLLHNRSVIWMRIMMTIVIEIMLTRTRKPSCR